MTVVSPYFESNFSAGFAAGLLTSVLWTVTSLFFTGAGKRIGPTAVNVIRIIGAVILLGITHRLTSGKWIPDFNETQLLWLALSGFIGLSIGDQALFTSFVDIGPRMSQLIMTTAPLFAAFFGFVALGEQMQPLAWVGIAMTISGVAWVVRERPETEIGEHPPLRMRGIILAFIAAACQACGLMLSKVGIGHGWMDQTELMSPQAATFIRMVFAGLGMIPLIYLLKRQSKRQAAKGITPLRTGKPSIGLMLTFCGTVVGPYLGVWMSLVAADKIPVGIAQTLSSLPPVLLLPIVYFLYREKITYRAVIGAVIAVAGVALLAFNRG